MTQQPQQRIDWFRVIADLNYAGLSNGRIAEELLLTKSWIARLRDGSEPRHLDGQMLLELWARVLDRQVDEAPKAGVVRDGAKDRARFLGV